MKLRFALALLLGMTCSLMAADDAKAQYGFNGGCGYGHGFGVYDLGRLYNVLDKNVPHFAAFPPVYYSAPVPRTYGYSPFAYPPGVMTPEIVESTAPVEIINPHVTPDAEAMPTATEDKVTRREAPRPLLVLNPYVAEPFATVQIGR